MGEIKIKVQLVVCRKKAQTVILFMGIGYGRWELAVVGKAFIFQVIVDCTVG